MSLLSIGCATIVLFAGLEKNAHFHDFLIKIPMINVFTIENQAWTQETKYCTLS